MAANVSRGLEQQLQSLNVGGGATPTCSASNHQQVYMILRVIFFASARIREWQSPVADGPKNQGQLRAHGWKLDVRGLQSPVSSESCGWKN